MRAWDRSCIDGDHEWNVQRHLAGLAVANVDVARRREPGRETEGDLDIRNIARHKRSRLNDSVFSVSRSYGDCLVQNLGISLKEIGSARATVFPWHQALPERRKRRS